MGKIFTAHDNGGAVYPLPGTNLRPPTFILASFLAQLRKHGLSLKPEGGGERGPTRRVAGRGEGGGSWRRGHVGEGRRGDARGNRTNLKCNNYLHGYELRGRDAQAPMMPHRRKIGIFLSECSNVLYSFKKELVSI